MNDSHLNLIINWTKFTTAAIALRRLDRIKEVSEAWANWLKQQECECVAYTFLTRQVRRWGKVTSNGVGNSNSAILPIQHEPIAYLVLKMMQYMQKK